MKNVFKKVRIGPLFFGSFAIFVAVILLLFSWITYTVTSKELADNTSRYQQDLLRELNEQLHIQLKSIEQISLAAYQNIEIIGYDPRQSDLFERSRRKLNLEASLANITYSTALVDSIVLYVDFPIETGEQASVKFKDLQQLEHESWYPQLGDSDFGWLPEHTIQSTRGSLQVISFSRQLYMSGRYYGLLLLNVKASEIQEIISNDTDERSRLLLDTGGRLVTSIGNTALIQHAWDNAAEIAQDSGSMRLSAADVSEHALLVWSRSPSGWMLVEVTQWGDIVIGSVRLALLLLGVGLAAIFISSFVIYYFSTQFTKPIQQLVKLMNKLPDKGKVDELPMDYTNEFGNLFNGYRKQMMRIEELVLSLKIQHKRQQEAEIKALQAMINPHFLYNTLDQLNWLAIESGQDKISRVASLMGKMFRIGLSNGEMMITLAEEWMHVDCYLQIQQIRWGDRLTYTITMDEQVKELYIPRLTLQPFIENAIIHGFHNRKSGHIDIEISLLHEELIVQIRDNGKGIPDNWKEQKVRKTGGYGLRNVIERIEALFGSPYGVDISRMAEGGTKIAIRLPKITINDRDADRSRIEAGGDENGQTLA